MEIGKNSQLDSTWSKQTRQRAGGNHESMKQGMKEKTEQQQQ
jgi:hypothetical protein